MRRWHICWQADTPYSTPMYVLVAACNHPNGSIFHASARARAAHSCSRVALCSSNAPSVAALSRRRTTPHPNTGRLPTPLFVGPATVIPGCDPPQAACAGSDEVTSCGHIAIACDLHATVAMMHRMRTAVVPPEAPLGTSRQCTALVSAL